MKKAVITMSLAAALSLSIISCKKMPKETVFAKPYTTEYEIPPFDEISIEDFEPAVIAGIEEAKADVDAIVNNPDAPTFENTIIALDNVGGQLDRVMRVLSTLTEADSSPELVAIEEKVSPLVSKFSDEMMMNQGLFERVKAVKENADALGLDTAQRRTVDKYYKSFVRNGAELSAEDQEKLKELNLELTDLYLQFNKNLLKANNDFAIIIDDEARLAGIPASVVANAAEEAKARGEEGKWAFTLHAPVRLPVLQYAADRDLRKQMYEGYAAQASSGENNNIPVINKILKARTAKAKLLGFPNYAAYMTDNVMAKTPQNAIDLLMKIWNPVVEQVHKEVAEMQAIVDAENGGFKIEPWDYYYYADKVRQKKYDLDESIVAPYFAADSVRKGLFLLAEKLYGVTFRELPDAPKYHPDVNVYEMLDADGKHVAIFMTDYYTRASKRQGAWMEEMKSSYIDENGNAVRPIIYNVCNFAKPVGDTPSLLTMDDVATTFHEFGHALHGMLSRAPYKSISGTNTDRDFVELPSQINEHWALDPALLKEYAHHYQTGEVIPDELIEKLNAASAHNAGFNLAERISASYLDMKYGLLEEIDGDIDIAKFEADVAEELGMPAEVQYRYHSPYFKHIFGSDGYACGYYTYTWAEVLDTDGFELFKERGVFDPETAKSFRENILEPGGSEDPMVLYVRFRGHEPSPEALLRHYGLAK